MAQDKNGLCGGRCSGTNSDCGVNCTCNTQSRTCVQRSNYITTTGRQRTGEEPYTDMFTSQSTRTAVNPKFSNASGCNSQYVNQGGCGVNQYYNTNDYQQFSNFTDDDMWSNHPGLFGWCWKGKKKCEADRQEKSYNSINQQHPFSNNDDCDTLDDRITKIDNSITGTATKAAGGRGAERVKNRTLNSLEKRRLQIKRAYEEQDCSQQRLDEQADEFNRSIMTRFDEQYARESKREEDDSLMYVAIGVGILVIGAVVVMSINRQPVSTTTNPV